MVLNLYTDNKARPMMDSDSTSTLSKSPQVIIDPYTSSILIHDSQQPQKINKSNLEELNETNQKIQPLRDEDDDLVLFPDNDDSLMDTQLNRQIDKVTKILKLDKLRLPKRKS